MRYTLKQLDHIATTIPLYDSNFSTVRWLFELFREEKIEQHHLEASPAFLNYLQTHRKEISDALLSEATYREKIADLNRELLKDAFGRLKKKSRSKPTNTDESTIEYMEIKFEQFHGYPTEHQSEKFSVLKTYLSDICMGTKIWIERILHAAQKRLVETRRYDENQHYYLAFFLTSEKNLIAVVGTDYVRTHTVAWWGTITLTSNFSDIVKIITDYWLQNADGTIEDALGPLLSDEMYQDKINDNDFDDYSFWVEDDDDKDDDDEEDDER